MTVRVLLFGVLQPAFGADHVALDLPPGANVQALRARLAAQHAAHAELLRVCAVAVNQQYAQASDALHEGDEVALLPPVSGGSSYESPNSDVTLVREPIVPEQLLQNFHASSDGAIATFAGTVRDNTRGRPTVALEYEAYEAMALRQMQALAEQACREHGVRRALLVHRLGRLQVGEISVFIAAASAHRAQAFAACRWLIDTLKATVPIWKKEIFADGEVWVAGEPFPGAAPR
jgi:molybdopterin converting factor subunit 1